MESIVIYKWLEPQLHWPLQVSALIILVLNIPQKLIQKLYSQLLKLSTLDRILFENAVEELKRRLMPELSVALTYSNQVLEERWTNSTPLMVMKKQIHQESGISNLQHITSNIRHLLPKPVLWFWLSWVDLITILSIMVILRFILNILHLNLTLNFSRSRNHSNQINWW